MNADKELLLRALDQAYDHRSWHGTNLRGSIRGLTALRAARRLSRGRHNIWEIVVHAAYWKYVVWRRLTGSGRGSFPLKGSNWFERPARDGGAADVAWRADVKLLADMHVALRTAVSDLPSDSLHQKTAGSELASVDLILGAAAHDLYHAGQIQLLKRLVGAS